MTNTQKIIKYFALALALTIIINIFYVITFGLSSLTNIFNSSNKTSEIKESETLNIENTDIISIDIDVTSVKLIIKENDKLKIETNNEYIMTNIKNKTLFIKEQKHNFNFNNENIDLIIYLPKNYSFDEIDISTGAGKIEIDTLNTKTLSLDLGAGKTDITNLNITEKADIEGGAGEINIKNTYINNLNLECGVGAFSFTGNLNGNNNIESGVGKLTLNLNSNLDNYKIKVEKGLGNATINNDIIDNNTYYGNGQNIINIEGGIGNIQIKTAN